MTVRAYWHDALLAESDDTVVVEGNHYFPRQSIVESYFTPSALTTTCHWKGEASYLTITVDGEVNKDAAWYYPQPKEEAKEIIDRVAFWKGVTVTEDPS